MELTEFQILNFRSINNSGPITVGKTYRTRRAQRERQIESPSRSREPQAAGRLEAAEPDKRLPAAAPTVRM